MDLKHNIAYNNTTMDYMYDIVSNIAFLIIDVYYTISETVHKNYNKYFVRDKLYYCYNNNKVYHTAPEGTNHIVIHTDETIITRFFGNYTTHTSDIKPKNLIVYFGIVDNSANEIDLTDLLNSFCIPTASLDFTKDQHTKWFNIIKQSHTLDTDNFMNWSIITADGEIYELSEFSLKISSESMLKILPKD